MGAGPPTINQDRRSRKKNFTPQYMQWAHQEDQLRSEILLILNPAKPEQERLIQTLESFGREADPTGSSTAVRRQGKRLTAFGEGTQTADSSQRRGP